MPEVLCLLIYFPPQLNAIILSRLVGTFMGLGVCSSDEFHQLHGDEEWCCEKENILHDEERRTEKLNNLPKVTQETSNRGMNQREVF